MTGNPFIDMVLFAIMIVYITKILDKVLSKSWSWINSLCEYIRSKIKARMVQYLKSRQKTLPKDSETCQQVQKEIDSDRGAIEKAKLISGLSTYEKPTDIPDIRDREEVVEETQKETE